MAPNKVLDLIKISDKHDRCEEYKLVMNKFRLLAGNKEAVLNEEKLVRISLR